MAPLSTVLRSLLAATIKKARQEAETGASKALDILAVGRHEPHGSMSTEERTLRNRLRRHGRQLGDRLDKQQGTQSIDLLVQEIAYEHWHRMLFARFLAENGLLIEPDNQVSITMEDCEELAHETGENPYQMAARFAQISLPQIFRPESPVFELALPPEHQQKLESLIAKLPAELFTASDSLGWVYQFWQTQRKEEVNKSEVKIGANELAPVTQLFTEPYMVSFLLDNSLGAWWANRRLDEADLLRADSEDQLRRKAAIPNVSLQYLRFVRMENSPWEMAPGTFPNWPDSLGELKVIDPCCGSGHFLVAAFNMLVPMRMELESLSAQAAVNAVLRENLHGLELDQRCVELAAFALALAAWTYPGAGGYRELPELHLACSGSAVSVTREEWKQLGEGKQNLGIALDWMYDAFRDAPVLGSLIDPSTSEAAKIVAMDDLAEPMQQALQKEASGVRQETAIMAQGLAKAATLLSGHYHWVLTNVPFLGRGKQNELLREYCQKHYPASKNNLATVFLERCLKLCVEGGTASIVLPQDWLFLTGYKKFREKLLTRDSWHLIARLGEGGFESSAAAGAFVALLTISRGQLGGWSGSLLGDAKSKQLIHGVDVSKPRTVEEKAAKLVSVEVKSVRQEGQLGNPDAIIILEDQRDQTLFAAVASCYQGTSTGDSDRFVYRFWEFDKSGVEYGFFEASPPCSQLYSGKSSVVSWNLVKEFPGAAVRERDAWRKKGILIGQMRSLPASIYNGGLFPNSAPAIIPHERCNLPALYSFCESTEFAPELRKINQKLSVDNGYVSKIPFDLARWTTVAAKQFPNGLPRPFSDDPTQWIFHGHPCGSVIWDKDVKWTSDGPIRGDETVLQVAVARLLSYRWPAELDHDMKLSKEQRAWVEHCKELIPFADSDGIVCLEAVRGEASAADRLRELLAAAYGLQWSNQKELELLASSSTGARPAADLTTWLRDHFFQQHCKTFLNRPFVWHIWDGLKDGFHCLINAHRLTGPVGESRRTLEAITYSYLGSWIERQRADQQGGKEEAGTRLAHALDLQKQLEKILAGEPPYDIFVRWKPLHEQPIGWEPDINDGIRLNIRPFMNAELRKGGKKGAGLLRVKPNIKWGKDRGKEPKSLRPKNEFPWFWGYPDDGEIGFAGGAEFDGNRWNDLHYSLEAKRKARQKRGEK